MGLWPFGLPEGTKRYFPTQRWYSRPWAPRNKELYPLSASFGSATFRIFMRLVRLLLDSKFRLPILN